MFLIAFFIVLLLLATNNILGLLPLTIYGYYLFRNERLLFRFSALLALLFLIHFFFLEVTIKPETDPAFSGVVIGIEKKENYQKLTLKKGHRRYLIHDYEFLDLSLGDVVEGWGRVLPADPARIEGGFDYRAFLKHRKVVKCVRSEELQISSRKYSWRRLKTLFYNHLEKNFEKNNLIFLKAMLVGDDGAFSEELKLAVQKNGILHLFAVSGLHIMIFVGIINKFLHFFKIKENIIILATSTFLCFYLVITGFAPSVLRAALMYYCGVLNKKLKLGFSSLDIASFCFLILILINPYYMYDHGFVLSFFAAYTIILFSPMLSSRYHFVQLLSISLAINIITLPVIINLNNEINLLSPLTNVIFIDLVEIVMLPASLLVVVLPFLGEVYEYLVIAFEKAAVYLGEKLYLPLRIANFSFLSAGMYYSLLLALCVFQQKKTYRRLLIILNLGFLFLCLNKNRLQAAGEVHFLDLYNGEAIFIQAPFNQCTALIDAGSGSNDDLVSFLKSKGIRRLDYLFLTHDHHDHNGGACDVYANFSVKKTVVSAYDVSGIGKSGNVLRVRAGDRVACGKINFMILHPDRDYGDENDNSIVILARIGNKNFLFLGDVGRKIEEKLLNYDLQVNVIKIAHHGSRTSTSPSFIRSLRPQHAIIQTGRGERFGFPHTETIATLEGNGVIIYRTDLHYSIKYRFRKNESIFETMG